MIELVNGYVCHNCAEASLAKQGKDPSARPGDPPGADKNHKISAFADQPATILGGALKGLVSANPVTPATASDPSQQTSGRAAPGIDFSV